MIREGAITVTRAFVDAVEDEVARVILGDRSYTLPASLLPDGVTEGSWIELRVKHLPEPQGGTPSRRATMGHDDDGGDLKL